MPSEHFGRAPSDLGLPKVAIPSDTSKEKCTFMVLPFEGHLIAVLADSHRIRTRSGVSWRRFLVTFELPLGGAGLPKFNFSCTWRPKQWFGSPSLAFSHVLETLGVDLCHTLGPLGVDS